MDLSSNLKIKILRRLDQQGRAPFKERNPQNILLGTIKGMCQDVHQVSMMLFI